MLEVDMFEEGPRDLNTMKFQAMLVLFCFV